MEIELLRIDDVLSIHHNQISLYGGDYAVRDAGLLESALAQPQMTFGGEFLHTDLYEMAAAYLFHLVKNHPFLDGNKRTGAVAALTFLDWNGIEARNDEEGLVEIILQVATGVAGKKEIAAFLRSLAE